MLMRVIFLAASVSMALLACSNGEAPPHDPAAPAVTSSKAVAPDTHTADPQQAPAMPSVSAGNICAGVDTQLTEARKSEYITLVADAVEDNKVKPSEVEIDRFMQSGAWSAAFASIPIADPGFFVFETTDDQTQYKDVWAGIADEEDRTGLIQWARSLGAPEDFASCFAETVIN